MVDVNQGAGKVPIPSDLNGAYTGSSGAPSASLGEVARPVC